MGIDLYGDWDRFERLLSSDRFREKLHSHMTRANRRIGLEMVRDIRAAIRRGDYAPNSPLTQAIKGSSKPLVDVGDLIRQVTYDLEANGFGVMIGVKRNAPAKDGKDAVSIAAALHEGFTIDLRDHPQVRRAVFRKLRKEGRRPKWTPMTTQTSFIWVIPPRPFIMAPVQKAWDDGRIQARWREAFLLALHEL